MKARFFLFIAFLCCCGWACEEASTSQSGGTTTTPTTTSATDDATNTSSATNPLTQRGTKSTLDCTFRGKRMEDNELWVKEEGVFAYVCSDSTSFNEDFGDSYRILSIYNTDSCTEIYRQLMPVNFSPDFPYYLSTDLYEANHQIICCQGFEYTYCYDVKNRRPLPKLTPQYLKARENVDAQSGMPQGLKIQGNYLFGFAQDHGGFAFDISNKEQPKAFLPVAEYVSEDDNSYPLFLLPEGQKYQAIAMVLDEEEMSTALRPLFDQAKAINPQLSKNVRNNRFLVFQEKVGGKEQRVAIDMKTQEQVKLPTAIVDQPVTAVLDWLKKNR